MYTISLSLSLSYLFLSLFAFFKQITPHTVVMRTGIVGRFDIASSRKNVLIDSTCGLIDDSNAPSLIPTHLMFNFQLIVLAFLF